MTCTAPHERRTYCCQHGNCLARGASWDCAMAGPSRGAKTGKADTPTGAEMGDWWTCSPVIWCSACFRDGWYFARMFEHFLHQSSNIYMNVRTLPVFTCLLHAK